MHWFWRAAIAVGAEVLYIFSWWYPPLAGSPPLSWLERRSISLLNGLDGLEMSYWGSSGAPWYFYAFAATIYRLPPVLVALAVYAILTRLARRRTSGEAETRCRKCGYILRGISEPRCPECGERI